MSIVARAQTWLARPMDYKAQWAAAKLAGLPYRLYCGVRGYDFDGFIPGNQLDGAEPASVANAGAFSSYPVRATNDLVSRALAVNPKASCFVDVGCGKGKQCHFVAKRFRFSRIVGMDFSPSLIAVARRNHRIGKDARISYVAEDATTWLLPDAPSVVFIANSFGEPIMRAFLANNRGHFLRHRSVMAYGNDTLRDLLPTMGFKMVDRSYSMNNSLYVASE